MSPDKAFGLAYVLTRWHNGQWSREYRILCKLGVTHKTENASKLLPRDDWSEARMWAAHYTRFFRNQ